MLCKSSDVNIASRSAICTLAISTPFSTKVKDNYIPVIVGVVGGALGILGMFVIPDFPANDVINACAVGIISGLASTGADQIYKQVKKDA